MIKCLITSVLLNQLTYNFWCCLFNKYECWISTNLNFGKISQVTRFLSPEHPCYIEQCDNKAVSDDSIHSNVGSYEVGNEDSYVVYISDTNYGV